MKLKNIFKFAAIAVASGAMLTGVTSCDYLDVVPPEQPSLPDAMKDHDKALGFLYSCYNGLNTANLDPRGYYGNPTFNNTTDEYILPEGWMDSEALSFAIMRNTVSSNQIGNWEWGLFYQYVGQCILFEQQLESVGKANGVYNDENEHKEWLAETRFLKAAYHFFILRQYGPIPLTFELIPMTASLSDYPGRSHYDYVTQYIVDALDQSAADFESLGVMDRKEADAGRASYLICKALKARVLLYAASDLWNGGFPYAATWKNKVKTTQRTEQNPNSSAAAHYLKDYTKPDTQDNWDGELGTDLVAQKPNDTKWARAYVACKEAVDAAEKLGYELWNSPTIPADDEVTPARIYVPRYDGDEFADSTEMMAFKEKVAVMRYAVSTSEFEGNREIIWSNKTEPSYWTLARIPKNVLTTDKGTVKGGYGGLAPTLESVEAFLTNEGTVPAEDPAAMGCSVEEFYTKVDKLTQTDPQNQNNRRAEMLKICVNREPRFYAWIGFHNGDYLTRLNNGQPKFLDFVKASEEGRATGSTEGRNYSATGFLSMKHVDPNSRMVKDNENKQEVQSTLASPAVFIRLAELYLSLAECAVECYNRGQQPEGAASDLRQEAIDYVNKIRERAGAHLLDESILSRFDRSLLEWVRHERRIELWNEGQRYFDVRRWLQGDLYFGADKRHGMNGAGFNKTFDDWCKVVNVDPQFRFHNRLYISPCFLNEVYKNPQMVQAPGY